MTTLISVVSYHVCYTTLGINNVASNIISWIFAVAFAFVTNKLYVFNSKSWGKDVMREVVSFFGFRLMTGAMETVLMYVAVDVMQLNGTASKLCVSVIVIVLNFVLSKFFVFIKKK